LRAVDLRRVERFVLVLARRVLGLRAAGFLPVSASTRIFSIVDVGVERLRRDVVFLRVVLRRVVERRRLRVTAPLAMPSTTPSMISPIRSSRKPGHGFSQSGTLV
jgi:hypothetical protein